jgi:hypothetical protein
MVFSQELEQNTDKEDIEMTNNPGAYVIKQFMNVCNKLECLLLAIFSSLVKCG